MTQKKLGRPFKTTVMVKKKMVLTEAVEAMFATSHGLLAELTPLSRQRWINHAANYKAGRMSLDKQLELLELAGFKQVQDLRFYPPQTLV